MEKSLCVTRCSVITYSVDSSHQCRNATGSSNSLDWIPCPVCGFQGLFVRWGARRSCPPSGLKSVDGVCVNMTVKRFLIEDPNK